MRTMLVAFVLVAFSGWSMVAVAIGQKKDPKEPPKVLPGKEEPKIKVAQPGKLELKGKVAVDVKVETIRKFEKPIATPPDKGPPERKGGQWRWHQHHGWVWLTVNVPQTVVLPIEYKLPPVIVYYEVEKAPIQVICPHCDKPIWVYMD